MDKSFNDQELSDIMKEIEALEEDFAASDATPSPVMEELASLDEEVSVPVATTTAQVMEFTPKQNTPVATVTPPVTTAGTTMNFKIQGDITLSLQFDIGGKSVSLEVTESGLDIEMDGGMKFTVPLASKATLKKAG